MGVHDAAHAKVEGGASQQADVVLAVHNNVTAKSVSFNPELKQQENQEGGAQQCGSRDKAVWRHAWNSWIG